MRPDLALFLSPIAFAATLGSCPAAAQSLTGSTVINLPSAETMAAGDFQFLVTHRTHDPVRGSSAHTLYSFDAGEVNGLGISFAPARHVEISLFRSETWDDYELALKYAIFPRTDGSPLSAALRVGGDDRRDPFTVDEEGLYHRVGRARVAYFSQGILTFRGLSDRIQIAALPSYSSRTVTERRVFNLPISAAVAVSRSWNVLAEYELPRARLRGSIAQWAFAVEKVTRGHRFSVVATNSNVIATDAYLSGDFLIGAKRQARSIYRNNDLYIGINLSREFKIGGPGEHAGRD